MVQKLWLPSALALVACAFLAPAFAGEKVTAAASAEDLTAEINAQIKDFETNLADASKFKAKANARAAGVLAALAQAVAENDGESAWKKSAADVRDAALKLGQAKTVDEAKAAVAAIKALEGKESTAKVEYDWAKFLDVHELMEEVQSRNSKLARVIRKGTQDADSVRHATVMAVLGLALEANPHGLKDKKDIENWQQYSQDFTKGFAGVSAALKAKEADKVKAAFSAVGKSCAACHEKYKDQ